MCELSQSHMNESGRMKCGSPINLRLWMSTSHQSWRQRMRSKDMTQSAIVAKLKVLLAKGITSEADALYLMVEVRKLLEQQQAKKQYEYLTFHCDWALHAMLEGTTSQKILKLFDAANIHLKTGVELARFARLTQNGNRPHFQDEIF